MSTPSSVHDNDVLKSEIDISVAVTCYNEEKLIVSAVTELIAAIKEVGLSYEIIVFNDASKDNSSAVVNDFIKAHPELPVRLVVNEINRGPANIFVDGAFIAKGKYYRTYYGDGSEDRKSTVHIFRQLGRADVLLPVQDQDAVIGKTKFRKFLSKSVIFFVGKVGGYDIGYYNGMPVFKRYHVLRFPPITYGFGYQIDIVTRLLDEGLTFCQVRPILATDRNADTSSAISMRNILSVAHTLIEIVFRRVRRSLYRKQIPRAPEVPCLPPS